MLRVLLVFSLSTFLCLCPPSLAGEPAAEEAEYRAFLDEGIALLRTGDKNDNNRATARFKSALRLRPESAVAYYWLALAFSDAQNLLRAADSAKDATIYDDAMPEAWSLWGQILLYQGEWQEALAKLEEAARLNPEDPVTQFNLGRALYHGLKDPDLALAKFRSAWQGGQAARRSNPDMAAMAVSARLYMGCCEFDRGLISGNPANFDNAINAYRDVIAEQPNNYDAMLRLALALRKVGRAGESEHLLRSLIAAHEQAGDSVDRAFLAEVNLQLADLYLKEPQFQSGGNLSILAPEHLRSFVSLLGNSNHPALEAAREYLAAVDGSAR